MSAKGKSQARALVRRGSRADRSPRVAALSANLAGPTVCDRCGAVYERKTWRAGPRAARTLLAEVRWVTCPACRQVEAGEYFGHVSIRGASARAHEAEILARIRNVAARAAFTQPERRIVSIDRESNGIAVLTTSQKLAHRIARELEKAFGGSAKYRWEPSDGSLRAEWRWSQ
jgi:NMD protein affecting ribosome stability and mRNA decay